MMSDTPRTEYACMCGLDAKETRNFEEVDWVLADFARQLERELFALRTQFDASGAMLHRAELALCELRATRAENAAIRELMNSYNVGGWTDALGPMKRALKAEELLRAALARLALKGDDADDLRAACPEGRQGC